MSIITRQGAHGLRMNHRARSGFTLPEVVVSLCILMMVLQCAWQWNLLTQRTQIQQQENRFAIALAEAALSNVAVPIPVGWQVQVTTYNEASGLQGKEVTVNYGGHSWEFYYAGETES